MDGHPHTVETRVKMSISKMGNKNPRWNDGASEYPNHSVLKRRRFEVLKMARGKCKICNEHAHVVHHIDDSKDNHELTNLMALCRKCHMALHKDEYKKGFLGRPSKYRVKYGVSQGEVAELFGVTPPTIDNWLKLHHKKRWVEKQLSEYRQGLITVLPLVPPAKHWYCQY